ncbi:restriction endonuclease fold toxin-2 domain-containing protein [Streptomyces sp. WI03-4A]|uniref:restriction endonuclease fold toxin-2 domain-containing protein n=1 Tax=Streptomyces sp. WI03-4A TaxID=3028706 RepID=UPI0029B5DE21|nr:restriction endonuclease fold toxin-2 domain-containing protein [Streptomyces sp. WI03-4A]MDX2591346.1 restriction endonuclease fold toxin-2 domain-containing protein [Streptomyces sp. WI03-4A]
MDLRHQTENFVNASWSMVGLRDLVYDMVGLLFTELSAHGGMAGDGAAGRAFAEVYTAAVKAVFDQSGFAHQVMASGAGALLNASEELLKRDDKVAAKLLEQSPFTPGVGDQPAGPDCTPRASHNAEDLPNVVGKTSGIDQYLFNERFLGQPDKLRTVAKTWRSAAKILHDAYWDSRDAWKTATLDQAGHAADAVEGFFEKFVGKTPPPGEVGNHDTLLANLPTACTMLANACDAYADHVETAKQRLPLENSGLEGDFLWPWQQPQFGGDGHDGGLHDLIAGDTRITSLGNIPHALDSSQSRVKMPQPDNGGFLPNLPPFLGPLIRVPTLVPAAYRPLPHSTPHIQPVPPAMPPDPRFPQLTPSQGQNFQTWLDSLGKGDISGGKPAEQAYQRRVSGFPEFEVPIPAGISPSNTLMVDGFRNLDGMAVEAKYVNKPNQRCYRSLEDLRKNHATGDRDFLYKGDRLELRKYAAALNDPRNKEMRGVETVTNNQDAVQYWRIMMAAYGVKGHARYVP